MVRWSTNDRCCTGTVSTMSWQQYLARDPAELVEPEEVVAWVRAYFHGDAVRGVSPFTGGFFDDLGHRGEPDPSPDQLTPADVLALEMLDARIHSEQIPWLLEDPEVGVLLAQIPADAVIWDDDAPGRTEPWQLWDLLHDRHGLGEVTISKLVARKRPHLIPVIDDVVTAALQPTRASGPWLWLGVRERLCDVSFRDRLSDIAVEADGPDRPLLRVLDVAIRMHDGRPRPFELDRAEHALIIS
jgi:hypothetical protein